MRTANEGGRNGKEKRAGGRGRRMEEEDGWRFWLSSVNDALTAKDRLTTFSVKDQ